jgi:ParB/RepB/Spo0J family partition protein
MPARGSKTTAPPQPVVQLIPIDKVVPPLENRDDLGDMEQLVASVKARGVAQAILVRPNGDGTYQIVFGERRWRGAKQAGLTTIKAEVRELDDLEAALEQLAENMDRKDLTSLEKAKALGRALGAAKRQGVRLGQREWAARLGKSQATVSKYLTLLLLHTQFPAFQQAYDAGRATDTDAVHLGKLIRQLGKDPELVERVLLRGRQSGIESAVVAELRDHERRQARAKVIAELEAQGAILAPDDWYSSGGRRLATLGLEVESHQSESCHAVWVDNLGRVEPVCMNPPRHAPAPSAPPPSSGASQRGKSGGSPTATPAAPLDAPAGGDGESATRQQAQREQAEAEQRAREAERQARVEAERARTAELEVAAARRRELLQTWLSSSGKLPRPLSDRHLFWQVVNLLGDQTMNITGVCDLLQVEAGSLAALLEHAGQGAEQLRRTALALLATWAEDRLRTEQDWRDPFIQEHYRLLGDLSYQPTEVETRELSSAHAPDSPDTPGQDGSQQHDS